MKKMKKFIAVCFGLLLITLVVPTNAKVQFYPQQCVDIGTISSQLNYVEEIAFDQIQCTPILLENIIAFDVSKLQIQIPIKKALYFNDYRSVYSSGLCSNYLLCSLIFSYNKTLITTEFMNYTNCPDFNIKKPLYSWQLNANVSYNKTTHILQFNFG